MAFQSGLHGLHRRVHLRARERETESFIRNNLHNGVVSGAARGQALRGPMWAGLTPDSKGDPTGDTGGLIAADRYPEILAAARAADLCSSARHRRRLLTSAPLT